MARTNTMQTLAPYRKWARAATIWCALCEKAYETHNSPYMYSCIRIPLHISPLCVSPEKLVAVCFCANMLHIIIILMASKRWNDVCRRARYVSLHRNEERRASWRGKNKLRCGESTKEVIFIRCEWKREQKCTNASRWLFFRVKRNGKCERTG